MAVQVQNHFPEVYFKLLYKSTLKTFGLQLLILDRYILFYAEIFSPQLNIQFTPNLSVQLPK